MTLNADDMNPLHTAAVRGLEDIVDVFVASDSGVDVSLAEKIKAFQPGGGGGGGTHIWFRRGCAAEAAKPVPIFKGHVGGKTSKALIGTY